MSSTSINCPSIRTWIRAWVTKLQTGCAGGQLLDKVAITGQAEVRWKFYGRWTTTAFGGGGRIADEVNELWDAENNFAGGVGLRYMLVEEQKLSIGIDVAFAKDASVAFYFQVGDWLAN